MTDFVIPWVDDGDVNWIAMRNDLMRKRTLANTFLQGGGDARFRDWDLLRYWFRGVEKFAPWVRKIHFVTVGHLPEWLVTDHPKLNIVRHEDYIPSRYLPTFSSHTIELNLHKIENLAEQFVYFNDDTFLTSEVKESDFFRKGLPCDSAIESPIYLTRNGVRAEINDLYAINANFNKPKAIFKHLLKWINPKYGHNVLRTFFALPYSQFTGFMIQHLPVAHLKSTFEEVWEKESAVLEQTCSHPFRETTDVNQWLMQYWRFCQGRFIPRSTGFGRSFEGVANFDKALAAIAKKKFKAICINDSPDIINLKVAKAKAHAAFESLLPEKSTFERV